MSDIQSALVFLIVIVTPIAALVTWVIIEKLKRLSEDVEPNRGGPASYHYGDVVQVTHSGCLATGEFKGIGPRIPGQPDPLRMCAIRAEWVDETGQRHVDDIAVPFWRIRGKVRQKQEKAVVWDTGKYLAQEGKWLLWGTEKERAG